MSPLNKPIPVSPPKPSKLSDALTAFLEEAESELIMTGRITVEQLENSSNVLFTDVATGVSYKCPIYAMKAVLNALEVFLRALPHFKEPKLHRRQK